MKSMVLSGAFLVLTAGAVGAVPITFDLSVPPGQQDSTNYNSLSQSFSLTVGGLTGTFTAGAFTNSLDATGGNRNIDPIPNGYTIGGPNQTLNPASDIRIGRYVGGAGVTTRPGDNHQVDGNGWDNFITAAFTFNGNDIDVGMSSVSFGLFNPSNGDDFRWGFDANDDGTYGTDDYLSFRQDDNPFTNFGTVQSAMYMFGAFDGNDKWKLKSITVDFTDPGNNVPEVPVPAALPLLAGGLGLMGLMGWRRKRKLGKA